MGRKKYDNTVKDFSKYGGVWCKECTKFRLRSLFFMYPTCTKYRWRMDMRAGVYMSGCCQGKRYDGSEEKKK